MMRNESPKVPLQDSRLLLDRVVVSVGVGFRVRARGGRKVQQWTGRGDKDLCSEGPKKTGKF